MPQPKFEKTTRLDSDVYKHFKQNSKIKFFNRWVNDSYRKEFMRLEKEIRKLEYHQQQVEESKSKIKMLKEIKDALDISREAYKWIKSEGLRRYKLFDPKSVIETFNQEFGLRVSKAQFEIYLKKALEESKKVSPKENNDGTI